MLLLLLSAHLYLSSLACALHDDYFCFMMLQ